VTERQPVPRNTGAPAGVAIVDERHTASRPRQALERSPGRKSRYLVIIQSSICAVAVQPVAFDSTLSRDPIASSRASRSATSSPSTMSPPGTCAVRLERSSTTDWR
jgi:hypothetical protein